MSTFLLTDGLQLGHLVCFLPDGVLGVGRGQILGIHTHAHTYIHTHWT